MNYKQNVVQHEKKRAKHRRFEIQQVELAPPRTLPEHVVYAGLIQYGYPEKERPRAGQRRPEAQRGPAGPRDEARVAGEARVHSRARLFPGLERRLKYASKHDTASQRREMETLDKVVKAASLGSAAVATAARRRALEDEWKGGDAEGAAPARG